ncbi:MAG: two-component regulator propeller domain-containing protein [Flavobacteriales bacterium]
MNVYSHHIPINYFSATFRAFFFGVFLSYLSGELHAQNASNSVVDFYTHYTINEGLSSNTCLSLLEDSRGFIWIGTAEGLNRFDGHRFRKFFHDPSNPNSICGNTILCLTEDQAGSIWIGTYGSGVTLYDPSKESYQQFRLETYSMALTRSNRVLEIVVLEDGKVFCGTEGGLFVKSPSDTAFKIVDAAFLNLPVFNVRNTKILHDSFRKGLWIYTAEGIYFYHTDTGKTDYSSTRDAKWSIFDEKEIMNLQLDAQHRLWYYNNRDTHVYVHEPELNATRAYNLKDYQKEQANKLLFSHLKNAILLGYWDQPAMFVSTVDGSVWKEPFTLSYPGSIGDARVNDVICSDLNLEWIATGKGLYVRRGDQPERQLHWMKEEDAVIRDLHVLNNEIWLATSKGLIIRNQKDESEVYVTDENIYYLYYSVKNNRLLFGKSDGVYEVDPQTHKSNLYLSFQDSTMFSFNQDAVQFIHEDSDDRLWVGTWFGNLTAINPVDKSVVFHASNKMTGISWPKSGLLSMAESDGELYIGFNGGEGVWKWNGGNMAFESYLSTANYPKFNGVADELYIDKNKMYIGTHGGGLGVWNMNENSFDYITRANGLVGDYVFQIEKLDDGNLLVVTNSGICALRTDNNNVRLINNDFTQEIPLFSFSGRPGASGEYWFWHKNYFYALRDGSDWNPVQKPVITGFTIFDQLVSLPESNQIHLNYDQNFFTVEFSGLPFLNKERIEYAYMLEGVNQDWVISRETNFAQYTNVSGGDYRFLVKSRMDGSNWTEPAFVTISIKPPFWTTWWFRTTLILVIALIVYAVYKYRINQLVKMQAVRNRISSDLHDDVGASLSSINIYSKVALEKLKRSPSEVPEMLEQISRNATDMMDNMSDIVWSINPRNDNLESLVNRMKIHAIEVLQPLDIEVHFSKGTLPENPLGMNARKNIYLIFKEIINNIAKHSKAQRADIEIASRGDFLQILITDNGRGVEDTNSKGGNGLVNLRSRVDELKGKLVMESQVGQGLSTRIEIPLARISDSN